VGLAEGVAADDQRGGLLVVHRHAAERLADVVRSRQRIRLALGPFGIDIDQAHRGRAVGLSQVPLTRVALVGAEPLVLFAEEDLLGLPHVGTTEAEAEGLEPGRLECHVAGEHQQVGPRDLVAVLLLHRPQQTTRLVQVGVVRPAVQRREALHALTAATTAVEDAVRARGVPAHADEQTGIAAVVRRPPILRGGDHRHHIGLEGLGIELGEFLRVVEIVAERVGLRRVHMQLRDVDLVGPPVLIGQGRMRFRLRRRNCRVLAFALARGLGVRLGRAAVGRIR
jgi:hypothetical protein